MLHFTDIDSDETIAGNQDFTSSALPRSRRRAEELVHQRHRHLHPITTVADLAGDGMIQLSGVLSGNSV